MSAEATGVIHDLGYRRYDGQRLGRGHIAAALSWHSLRSAFGIGRGAKAKILPIGMFAVMCLPAVVSAVIVARSAGHVRDIPYDTYVLELRVVVMAIFVAVQAPELVSRDLRSRVLPLYLCRPLRRGDYLLAKYAAFTLACLVVIDIPLLILYAGTIASASHPGAVWSETRALVPGLLIGVLWAVVLAAIGLALASLSGRRPYATGAIAGYFFLSTSLAAILITIGHDKTGPGTAASLAGLISPFTVLDGLRRWLGGTSPGPVPHPGQYGPAYAAMLAVLFAAGLGGLAARYRKVSLA